MCAHIYDTVSHICVTCLIGVKCDTFTYASAHIYDNAADLDIVSGTTGRGDGLAMNIAGGAASVQAQALKFGITSADVAQAARGTAGYFSAMASEATAADLDIVSAPLDVQMGWE